MKTIRKFVLSAATLAAVFAVTARAQSNQSTAPALPVISVQEVSSEDPTGYAMWVGKTNALVKQKLNIEPWIRSYLAVHGGEKTGIVLNVMTAENFTSLLTRGTKIEKDADILENAQHYRGLRKLGDRMLLKATRFDGRHLKNAVLYNTYATLPDEAGYMKSLDQLRALFDQHGMKDCHINVFRVAAGRSDYTHVISINLASMERLGALLDSMSAPWMTDWFATAAKQRTVVRNATYREITQ